MILAVQLHHRQLWPAGRRMLVSVSLLVLVTVLAFTPMLRLAPASFYLLLADVPGAPAGPISRVLGPPSMSEWQFAGVEGTVDADVYAPRGTGVHPTILVINGALSAGRKYPPLAQFGAALAQSGFTAVIPDYPDLLKEVVSPASLQDVEYTVQHLGAIPGADGRRVEVVGFCVGATLGLLAAEDPQVPPIRAVVALSGYISSLDMIQLITTGTYWYHNALVPFAPDPWVVVAVARSMVMGLPNAVDRAVFAPFLTDPPPDHYVAPEWSHVPRDKLTAGGQALLSLLENHDPSRVPGLVAGLPAPLPTQLAALSPVNGVLRLQTPVYIVADHQDTYIPNAESIKLAEAAPSLVHLSYISLLAHVEPTIEAQANPLATVWDVANGAWQLFLAIDRTLAVVQ